MAMRPGPTNRRTLLTAAIAGVAAGAAGAVGRVLPASAGPTYVQLGTGNTSGTPTTVTNNVQLSQFSGPAIEGRVNYLFGGNGVQGYTESQVASGVYGENVSGGGWGVAGRSTQGAGVGVFGDAKAGVGVHGVSASSDGVRGESSTSNGVMGRGQATSVSGVYGENYAAGGYGVAGHGPSIQGIGVRGTTEYGTGIYAYAFAGTALVAETGHATANALRVQGRASFSTSGLSKVPVGDRAKTIDAGYDLVASSKILCTLEADQADLFIQRITKDVNANTFRVILSDVVGVGKTAKVAWFAIG